MEYKRLNINDEGAIGILVAESVPIWEFLKMTEEEWKEQYLRPDPIEPMVEGDEVVKVIEDGAEETKESEPKEEP
jgi:hypothetical protein